MTKSCTTLDLEAFDATRSAVEADLGAGKGAFQATTSWIDGARAKTTARSFTIETDEPSPLGGTDQAVGPMELLLASVGTCLTIGWVTHAARRGVDLRDLRIDVTGDYDLRGYFGIDEPARLRRHFLHRPRRHRRRRCHARGDPQGRRSWFPHGRQRRQRNASQGPAAAQLRFVREPGMTQSPTGPLAESGPCPGSPRARRQEQNTGLVRVPVPESRLTSTATEATPVPLSR